MAMNFRNRKAGFMRSSRNFLSIEMIVKTFITEAQKLSKSWIEVESSPSQLL
jgi:hypothetical protein